MTSTLTFVLTRQTELAREDSAGLREAALDEQINAMRAAAKPPAQHSMAPSEYQQGAWPEQASDQASEQAPEQASYVSYEGGSTA